MGNQNSRNTNCFETGQQAEQRRFEQQFMPRFDVFDEYKRTLPHYSQSQTNVLHASVQGVGSLVFPDKNGCYREESINSSDDGYHISGIRIRTAYLKGCHGAWAAPVGVVTSIATGRA
eukprot:159685_1